MPSWLNQHRKSELADLAALAGINDIADLRKDQIVAKLDDVLLQEASRMSRIPEFQEYYNRRGSPMKRESGANASFNSDVDIGSRSVGRNRAQRVSRIKGESDASEPASSPTAVTRRPAVAVSITQTPAIRPATQTPATRPITQTPAIRPVEADTLLSPPRVPLPPSPAVVTDVIEEQTARISSGLDNLWQASHITDFLYQVRLELSSITGIQISILAFESLWLHRAIVPWNFAFDVPSLFGFPSFAVFLPDLFVLLTHYYWSTTILWAVMNFWIPLATGWFWNLSLKLKSKNGVEAWNTKYRVDPLIFSIAKALSAWLVFSQQKRFAGLFADETVDRVEGAMPVGYSGVMVAAYIGVATSIWDAIQGKKGWQ